MGFPHGAAGRKLGSFNWTGGTVNKGEKIVKMPTQVLKLGQSDWWSVGTAAPFKVCVQYNELLPDGQSDPNSAFEGCFSGPGLCDITRGTTHNLDASATYGYGSKPDGSKMMWAQLV